MQETTYYEHNRFNSILDRGYLWLPGFLSLSILERLTMRTITNTLMAGLLRSAFERGYMAGVKRVANNEGAVPVSPDAYRNEVRSAGNRYIQTYHPDLYKPDPTTTHMKVV